MNCEEEEVLQERYDVSVYPTFKLFRDGMLEEIGGGAPLTGEGVIAGLRQYLGLPTSSFARELSSLSEARDWLFNRGRSDLSMRSAVMGFFPPGVEDEASLAAFENAAAALSSALRFGRVTQTETIETFHLPLDKVSLVLYKDYDEGKEVYAGELTGEALAAWATVRNKPLATRMDVHNIRSLQRDVPVIVHVFTNERGYEEMRSYNTYLEAMRTVGRSLEAAGLTHRGNIVFTLVNAEKRPQWMEAFGLPPTNLPAVALADNKNDALYALTAVPVAGTLPTDEDVPELDVAAITQFCESFYAGLLTPVPAE